MAVVTANQAVSLHTYGGIQLYQYLPEQLITAKWTRELRAVSRCELTVPPISDPSELGIFPFLHWISVWDMDINKLLWTGPITKVVPSRSSMRISAGDVGALMSRTRIPITKRWDAADPADIAAEIWAAMIENKGLKVKPIVRPDPEGDRFDHQLEADTGMVDKAINDLAQLGLRWTVVSGVPILGPVGQDPIAALSEDDFIDDALELVRDGSLTFNDILMRGADAIDRVRVEMAGLNLETIVDVDSMFGVSNVARALHQYARHTAAMHDYVSIPSGAVLDPDAPVSIEQLIPSARFTLSAFGLLSLMELSSMEVSLDSGDVSVGITLENVVELPELSKPDQGQVAVRMPT